MRKNTKTRRPRRTVAKDGPNPIDIHVGKRLRLRRTLLGMSQSKLGELVDLTFQQIQKYERGANRIGASRLFEFCRILDVPVSYFFEGSPDGSKKKKGLKSSNKAGSKKIAKEHDPFAKRETLQLVRAYYRISNPEVRLSIRKTISTIANAYENDS